MSTDIQVREVSEGRAVTSDRNLAVGGQADLGRTLGGLPPEKVGLLKRTIAKDCTDDELELFLADARHRGLDPFARQIYAIKRKDRMTIQVSIDGFRLVADRTGDYLPGQEPTFKYGPEGELISATAYVKRYRHGEWHEVSVTAFYDEYVQMYQGKPAEMWATKPHIMLSKCAESLALRKAFPAELAGLYTDDEMGQADNAAPPRPMEQHHRPDPGPQPEPQLKVRVVEGEVIAPPAKKAPHDPEREAAKERFLSAGRRLKLSNRSLQQFAKRVLDKEEPAQMSREDFIKLAEEIEPYPTGKAVLGFIEQPPIVKIDIAAGEAKAQEDARKQVSGEEGDDSDLPF